MDDLGTPDLEARLEGLIGDDGDIVTPEPVPETPETPEAKAPEQPEAKTQEEKPAEEPKYKVTVNGQEMEVSLPELLKGYQLQSDYTQKTQKVAEERKAVEGEKEKLSREREEFVQNASSEMLLLHRQIEADAKADWQALLDSDPVEYMRRKEAAEARRQQYFQLRHQSEQVVEALQQEQQEQQSAFVAEQREILKKEMPDYFGDEAKTAETKKQLREFMTGQGFTEAEIANVADARGVKLLINAMRYDQLQKAKVEEAKRVKPVPPKVESADAQSDDSGSRLNKAAFERLVKSGGRDTSAAQRAIESLL